MKANKKKGWTPRWRANLPEDWEQPQPTWSPQLSNHIKMQLRAEQRRVKRPKKEASDGRN